MSASYDKQLSTTRDWVRFLIGDTVVTGNTAKLQDEELDALIAGEVNAHGDGRHVQFLVAAMALDTLLGRWRIASKGIVEKQVAELRIRRSVGGGSVEEDVRKVIESLREQGAAAILSGPGKSAVFGLL